MKELQDLLWQHSVAIGDGSPARTNNNNDAKDEEADWEFVSDVASVHSCGSVAAFPSLSTAERGEIVATVHLSSSYRDMVLRTGAREDAVLVRRATTNKELPHIQDTPPRSTKPLPTGDRSHSESRKGEQLEGYLCSSSMKNPSSKRSSSSGHTMRRHVSGPCSGQTREFISSSKKVMDKDHCDLHKTWGCKGQQGSRTGRHWLKKQRRHEAHASRQKRKEALRQESKQLD